jgi:hypothetical protein
VVGDWSSLGAIAQQPTRAVPQQGSLRACSWVANRRVRVTARSRRNERFQQPGASVR